ncbi:MAG: uroporphyrinogen decarboxylase family protein [Anaerolineae bacterium]|nr:uroporphyrinogen decarboxylase family protein [Thermoflexales bacterium]MDW8406648.1 uroporphyrinogen decarboxylase family protein [Anaerolineae bacterium]
METTSPSVTRREIVARAIRFQTPPRLPFDLPEPYGTDITWAGMTPSPDHRPPSGIDEWGAVWENIGVSMLGEVKDFPLKDWADFDRLPVPDIREPRRWVEVAGARQKAGDKFLLGHGLSIYERLHFIRGLHNTWTDIYDAPAQLGRLIDILVEMNLYAIEQYANAGFDGFIIGDDWGLQNRLMIDPRKWREIWKPRYARIFKAAHDAGLFTFLHSCGHIVAILDDLIEIGLDVIHMDQQENMGLELLGRRFGGRLTFYAPVDIQRTMVFGTLDEIRAYCRRMVHTLGRPEGGFIARWYTDPAGAGHRPEAIAAMCEAFLQLAGM